MPTKLIATSVLFDARLALRRAAPAVYVCAVRSRRSAE